MVRRHFVPVAFVICLAGCRSGADGPQRHAAEGAVQKGPFSIGATITIQELDPALVPSGRTFGTTINDDLGTFDLAPSITSDFIDVAAAGFYFDEISGSLSTAPLTLRAYANLSTNQIVNVNALTDLQSRRIATLVGQGIDFDDAEPQARAEVLQVFGIPAADASASPDDMNITEPGDNNAILLAASAILQQVATLRASSPTTVVAELSSLLATVREDLATDGLLSDATIVGDVVTASTSLDLSLVRQNLVDHYSALGTSVNLPAFEGYVDSDGDGLLNRYDYSLAFAAITTTAAGATITSESLPIQLFDSTSELAIISDGSLVVNGVDSGGLQATVSDGDLVAIRMTSAISFGTDSLRSAEITIGRNHGSFTLTTLLGPKLIVESPAPDSAAFGVALAILANGNVVIGASAQDVGGFTNAGAAYVVNGTSGEIIFTFENPDPDAQDSFGDAVAAIGNKVAIAARQDDPAGVTDAGTVYIYDGETGQPILTIPNPEPETNDQFGYRLLSVGGDLLVGTPGEAVGALTFVGTAYLMDITTGTVKLEMSNPSPAMSEGFGGHGLTTGAGKILIAGMDDLGAIFHSGAVHVFDATTGAFELTIPNPDPVEQDAFGWSTTLVGGNLVVGAQEMGSAGPGTVYVFQGISNVVSATIPNPEPAMYDAFGSAVCAAGENIFIGAYGNDDAGGDAYLFSPNGSLISPLPNPSNAPGEYFGWTIAPTPDGVLISAYGRKVGTVTFAGVVYRY